MAQIKKYDQILSDITNFIPEDDLAYIVIIKDGKLCKVNEQVLDMHVIGNISGAKLINYLAQIIKQESVRLEK